MLGRFMQRDTSDYSDSLDLYEFLRSKVIAGSDPSGQQTSTGESGLSMDVGFGVGFGAFATGIVGFTCCDDKDCRWLGICFKICYGFMAGVEMSAHIIDGLNGEGCPDRYSGWFGEGNVNFIPAGPVFFGPSGAVSMFEDAPTAVIVGGVSASVGPSGGGAICHYSCAALEGGTCSPLPYVGDGSSPSASGVIPGGPLTPPVNLNPPGWFPVDRPHVQPSQGVDTSDPESIRRHVEGMGGVGLPAPLPGAPGGPSPPRW